MPSVTLPSSGRVVSYREFGDLEHGFPLFFNHGGGNSSVYRPCWEKSDEVTKAAGARVISVDRPGIGESTFYQRDGYASWASVISELADVLGIGDSFGALGFSSGGPNALATAAGLPRRVKAVGLFSSDCPYFTIGDDALSSMKYPTREQPRPTFDYELKRAAGITKMLRESYSGMKNVERRAVALQDLDHATTQGLNGCAMDQMLETREWNFDLATIKQPVLMWHGTKDEDIPVAASRRLASMLPNVQATFMEGESHSLIRRQWQGILEAVIAAARAAPSKL